MDLSMGTLGIFLVAGVPQDFLTHTVSTHTVRDRWLQLMPCLEETVEGVG